MTREEAIARLEANRGAFVFKETNEALDMAIEALQTLEAAEKLRTEVLQHIERKQGKWITCHDVDKDTDVYECNQCRFVNWFPSTFCPDCGTQMERRPK